MTVFRCMSDELYCRHLYSGYYGFYCLKNGLCIATGGFSVFFSGQDSCT